MDSMKNPVTSLMENPPLRWQQEKKGAEKPKQVKGPGGGGGPGEEVADLVQQVLSLMQELKNKLPENSEPGSQIAGMLNQLTILHNRLKSMDFDKMPPSAETPPLGGSEAGKPGGDILSTLMGGSGGGLGPAPPGSSTNLPGGGIG